MSSRILNEVRDVMRNSKTQIEAKHGPCGQVGAFVIRHMLLFDKNFKRFFEF